MTTPGVLLLSSLLTSDSSSLLSFCSRTTYLQLQRDGSQRPDLRVQRCSCTEVQLYRGSDVQRFRCTENSSCSASQNTSCSASQNSSCSESQNSSRSESQNLSCSEFLNFSCSESQNSCSESQKSSCCALALGDTSGTPGCRLTATTTHSHQHTDHSSNAHGLEGHNYRKSTVRRACGTDMPAEVNKALKLSADISLHAVSCPGVWLPGKGRWLGRVSVWRAGTCECLQGWDVGVSAGLGRGSVCKTFLGVRSLGALEAVLERETVYLELVQEEGGGGGGEAVLAVFECSVKELLFPAPSRRNSYSGMDLDLLMEPTRDFPGIISPKVEVSTRSTVKETRSPLHECQTDNVSFGHSSDGGTKGTYQLTAAPDDAEADEGVVTGEWQWLRRGYLQVSGHLTRGCTHLHVYTPASLHTCTITHLRAPCPDMLTTPSVPSEKKEADQARGRPVASPAPERNASLSSKHRSRSEGNLTDIQYGQLSSRYGGSRPSPRHRASARTARLDEAHDAIVSDLGPEVCQHCEGSHSSQSCTTCRLYSQYFPHSSTSPHPCRVLYQPRGPGGRLHPRTRKRYLTDDLRWRARPSGARPQRPSSAPPMGRRPSPPQPPPPPAAESRPQPEQENVEAQEEAQREDRDEGDLEAEEDEPPHQDLRITDRRSYSPSIRLSRRPGQRTFSNFYTGHFWDDLPDYCYFCCDPPSPDGLPWYRPYYDRPYSRSYYRPSYLDYPWSMRGQPPWYSRLQIQSFSTVAATVSSPSTDSSPSSKDYILADYSNCNPRNMELLRLARQPQGYPLDSKHLYYWNRLELQQSGRFLTGYVRQASGKVVVKASTREWPLQSRLYSTSDHSAVVSLARVLARRCLEAGYSELAVDPALEGETSSKAKAFMDTLFESGVRLTEDFQLHETDMYPWAAERPTLPWQVPEHVALADSDDKAPPPSTA
ncbi:Spermatogenesis-associated protein 6 N-terminal [Trinorchestia longiramus]|nr:Spermatogenesis-associated protein 6 N-terminal [Trinorchestia longiramus]